MHPDIAKTHDEVLDKLIKIKMTANEIQELVPELRTSLNHIRAITDCLFDETRAWANRSEMNLKTGR